MDLEGVTLSETGQTEKDKHHMLSLICGLKITIKLIDTEKRSVVARGGS